MNRINQEGLKSYILITLILTSLIQIGILWNYQYQNIPINVISSFFANLLNMNQQPIQMEADEYIKPYRIIATEGIGEESHWALYKSSEAVYGSIWNDFKTNYLKKVISVDPVQSFPKDQWRGFIDAKGFILEYKTDINLEIFAGLLGEKDFSSNRPSGIYKVLISPWEDVNYNLMTIYILDDTKVYKYVFPISEKGLAKDTESNSFDSNLKKLQSTTSLRQYLLFKELIPGKFPYQVSPDILIVAKGTKDSKFSSYKNLILVTPNWLTQNDKSNQDVIAQNLLKNERDNYDLSVDKSNSVIMRNSNNIFKVYSNGSLEYKFLSVTDGENKGSVYEAFKKANEFIDQKRDLISGLDVYLSGMSISKENKGIYNFTFDYCINDLPVILNYGSNESSVKNIKNAITITADNNRVLSCQWILRSASSGKESNLYNVSFEDSWNEILKMNTAEIKADGVEDICVGYFADSPSESNLPPKWIITSQKNENFYAQMLTK